MGVLKEINEQTKKQIEERRKKEEKQKEQNDVHIKNKIDIIYY